MSSIEKLMIRADALWISSLPEHISEDVEEAITEASAKYKVIENNIFYKKYPICTVFGFNDS